MLGVSLFEVNDTVASFSTPVEKDKLIGSHCLLPISVGELSHDLKVHPPQVGRKFKATIDLINRSKFGHCTILIDDTIQMATYRILSPEKTDAQLYEITFKLGDKWIEENEKFYSALTMSYMIKRWDKDVAQDPLFSEGQKKIRAEYASNPDYRRAFDVNINQFLDRLKKRGVNFERDVGYKQCLEYLLDENAGMGFVWPTWEPKFEIYPSGRNASMSATYDLFIKGPEDSDLLSMLSLRFKKRKNKKQETETLEPNFRPLSPGLKN